MPLSFRAASKRCCVAAPTRVPKHYVRIPDQLLRAALHTPRVIAVYALVARTWLLRGEATPLSSQDINKFDPSFSRGAAQRALVWLIDHGWLVAARRPGLKSSLTPTWGTIRGEPRVWNAADSHAGRPPHVKTHTLDVRLFDLFMGRLIPFDGQRGARVTRYLSTPALTLDDVGSYALLMAGYGGGTTLQLEQHGLATAQQALPLADDQTILARLSCGAGNAPPCLTHAGLRRAGLAVADSASTTAQPIFFVPRELIGNLLGSVIDHSIAETAGQVGANRPLQSGQPPLNSEASAPEIMPWKSNDQKNREPPTRHRPRGGGRRAPEVVIEPLPATASTERLKAAHVAPESIRRLAHVPIEIVDELIAYAEAEPTIRSKQGWLVWALQAYLAYGFRPIRAALEQPDWAALVHQSNTEVLSNELHAADTNTYVNEKAECDAEHQTAHVTGGASVVAVCAQSPEQCVEAGDVAERLRSDMRWMYGPRTWRSIEGCFAHAQAEFDGQTVRIVLPAPAYRQVLAGELRQMLQRTVAAWPVASGVRPKVAISQQL